MKTASPELIAHLTSGRAFRRADLYTFTDAAGAVLGRYTTLDAKVTIGAVTWSASGPVFTRSAARQVVGVAVDAMEVTVAAHDGQLLSGVTWPVAVRRGVLDGVRVLIERCYMPTWGDVSLGKLYVFDGRIGKVTGSPRELTLEIRSDLELLNAQTPPRLYQPRCLHTLYDAGCTVSKATFAATGTVDAGSTESSVLCNLAQADGWFSYGRIQFTSGALSGVTRAVKGYVVGALSLAAPLASVPAAGVTFTAWPGCDRLRETCEAKFVNLDNFLGMPYVPQAETAV